MQFAECSKEDRLLMAAYHNVHSKIENYLSDKAMERAKKDADTKARQNRNR